MRLLFWVGEGLVQIGISLSYCLWIIIFSTDLSNIETGFKISTLQPALKAFNILHISYNTATTMGNKC